MSLITRLVPNNLLQEKELFFNDKSYNPQFRYEEPVDEIKLTNYGLPEPELIEKAQLIVDQAYFHRNEVDLEMLEGPLLPKEKSESRIKAFLKLHNLQKRFNIVWSSSFLSRTSITSDTIKLRLPAAFRQEGLLGMLYHEVGTHALRRINYEKQPWFRQKNKYGFDNYLSAEEGLATIHGLLPRSYQSAYRVALKYLGVQYAQTHSFAELWQWLGRYTQDSEKSWQACVRLKRGLTDTSQPGGFTKDLAYFKGFIEVGQWLKTHNYDPTQLYWGKMALADVEKAVELNPSFKPLLPTFLNINVHDYVEKIKKILTLNHFD